MRPARRADVVVVGAGLFGTSIALQLARCGEGSVLLLERATPGAGDSGVCFSMLRRHYSNEATARLAMRGVDVIERWREEVGTGESGYVRTGYLLTATAEQLPALERNVRRLASWGLDTRVVAPAEIAELEPLLARDGIAGGAYEPGGGFADAQAMTLSWFAASLAAGVEARLGCRVGALSVTGGRVVGVETDSGPIGADVVVLAAGAWTPDLARTAGIEIALTLRPLQVALLRQAGGGPQVRLTFSDMASGLVMRPDRAGIALVVTYEDVQPLAARDECSGEVDPGYEPAVRAALRERVPAYAEAAWLGGFAGTLDGTADWNPILGWAPGVPGLYLALGSGHGFKLAPAVGEVAADQVFGRRPAIDVSALDPARFARGEALANAYGQSVKA